MNASELKPGIIVRGPVLLEPIEVLVVTPLGDVIKIVGAGQKTGQVHQRARQAHEVVVDCLELVRQWVNAGDREGEVWIVLVGEPQACGLDAETEARRVAIEWLAFRSRLKELKLVGM